MSDVTGTKSQEEYEDDFEKDLDWLISEEGRREDQDPNYDDIEADIDKELEEDEKLRRMKPKAKGCEVDKRNHRTEEMEDEDRWPSPMEPLEYDPDRDSPSKSSTTVPPPPGLDDQTDEEKKYILEKIQQANRDLQDQEAPDATRRRRLHFKETLVTLVVSPLQFEKDGTGSSGGVDVEKGVTDAEAENEVSGRLSELKLSAKDEGQGRSGGQGRVLVEKDGKFDLVSLKEVESQGLLPPLATSPRAQEQNTSSGKDCPDAGSPPLRVPRPPDQPRNRPSSASHGQRDGERRGAKRRVQSASGTPCQATYRLSPQQKELLLKVQERKEKLAREAEERKLEEEEQRRQENDLAFKAWLMRKRGQLQEERRIHQAREMERMNSKKDSSDPEEAFQLWLQRKRQQQQREKQLLELKRMEEDTGYLLRSREECERAFRLWLTRKRAEKRAQQQAARERSRRMVLEERRARRMRDLMCTANESKPFRFSDQMIYRF